MNIFNFLVALYVTLFKRKLKLTTTEIKRSTEY